MKYITPELKDRVLTCKFEEGWDILDNFISAKIEFEDIEEDFKGKYTVLIFDFNKVFSTQSTGIGLIINKVSNSRKNGIHFKLINVSDITWSVLSSIRVIGLFDIEKR